MLEQVKKLHKQIEVEQGKLNGTATTEQLQQLLATVQTELGRIIEEEATKAKIAKLKARLKNLGG